MVGRVLLDFYFLLSTFPVKSLTSLLISFHFFLDQKIDFSNSRVCARVCDRQLDALFAMQASSSGSRKRGLGSEDEEEFNTQERRQEKRQKKLPQTYTIVQLCGAQSTCDHSIGVDAASARHRNCCRTCQDILAAQKKEEEDLLEKKLEALRAQEDWQSLIGGGTGDDLLGSGGFDSSSDSDSGGEGSSGPPPSPPPMVLIPPHLTLLPANGPGGPETVEDEEKEEEEGQQVWHESMAKVHRLDALDFQDSASAQAEVEVERMMNTLTTMDRVLLDLHHRPGALSKSTFRAFVKGLELVSDDISAALDGLDADLELTLLTLTTWERLQAFVVDVAKVRREAMAVSYSPKLPSAVERSRERAHAAIPDLVYTPLNQIILNALSDPTIMEHYDSLLLRPHKPQETSQRPTMEREFCGPKDGLWLEQATKSLPPAALGKRHTRILAIALYADETKVFGNDEREYPMYLSFPSLPLPLRNKDAARFLVALLPRVVFGPNKSQPEITSAVYLDCVAKVFASISFAAVNGWAICNGAESYIVFPRLMTFVGDTPERKKMLGLRGGMSTECFCDNCVIPSAYRDRGAIPIAVPGDDDDNALTVLTDAVNTVSVERVRETLIQSASSMAGPREKTTMAQAWGKAQTELAKKHVDRINRKTKADINKDLKSTSLTNLSHHPLIQGNDPSLNAFVPDIVAATSCADYLHVVLLGVGYNSLAFAVRLAAVTLARSTKPLGRRKDRRTGEIVEETQEQRITAAMKYVTATLNQRGALLGSRIKFSANFGNLLLRGSGLKGEEVRALLLIAPFVFDSPSIIPPQAVRGQVIDLFLQLNHLCNLLTSETHTMASIILVHNICANVFDLSKDLFTGTLELTRKVRDHTTASRGTSASRLPEDPVRYPKMHFLLHFAESILWFGSPTVTDTMTYELLHGIKIKPLARKTGARYGSSSLMFTRPVRVVAGREIKEKNAAVAHSRQAAAKAMTTSLNKTLMLRQIMRPTRSQVLSSNPSSPPSSSTVSSTPSPSASSLTTPGIRAGITLSRGRSAAEEQARIARARAPQGPVEVYSPKTLSDLVSILHKRCVSLGMSPLWPASRFATMVVEAVKFEDDGIGTLDANSVDPTSIYVTVHPSMVLPTGEKIVCEPMIYNGCGPRFDNLAIEVEDIAEDALVDTQGVEIEAATLSEAETETATEKIIRYGQLRAIFTAWPKDRASSKSFVLVEDFRLANNELEAQLDGDPRDCLHLHLSANDPAFSVHPLRDEVKMWSPPIVRDISTLHHKPHRAGKSYTPPPHPSDIPFVIPPWF